MSNERPLIDTIFGPFRLVWENLEPEYAIPLMAILAVVYVVAIVEMFRFMMSDSNDSTEPEESTNDREWQFYPEDFEQ